MRPMKPLVLTAALLALAATAGGQETGRPETGLSATPSPSYGRTDPATGTRAPDARDPSPASPRDTGTTGMTRTPSERSDGQMDAGARTLPATASPLPLAGLAGLLSVSGALALGVLRRRRV